MRQLPILFSTPMVQAILENRKTMTRRMSGLEKVNENPDDYYATKIHSDGHFYFPLKTDFSKSLKVAPRYHVGDKLWVKEEYYAIGYWSIEGTTKKQGKPKFRFHDATIEELGEKYQYYDSVPSTVEKDRSKLHVFGWWKRNSLFMPQSASRIWLECTGVRCERLEDITEVDAISEGVESKIHKMFGNGYKSYILKDEPDLVIDFVKTAKDSFIGLWISINEESYNLNSNPWVFVYEFKRI